MSAKYEAPDYTIGGLLQRWAKDPACSTALGELRRVLVPLESRLVKGFRLAQRQEREAGIVGCGVRDEDQLRKAIRRELESKWSL